MSGDTPPVAHRRMRARFRLLAVLQVFALLITIGLLVYLSQSTSLFAVPILLGGVVVLQVVGLLRSVESHVRTLEEFFAAVDYEDFTRRFISGDVDEELKSAYNKILERFAEARADREAQANYLETVVRHVPVPLISADADGALQLVNNPARRLTGLPGLDHIDDLAELDDQLPALLRAIDPGRTRLLQTRLHGLAMELRVAVSEIRFDGATQRLYSIENLSGELTARESSAWRNLIRVLTHEIMNTLTPVTSLAHTSQSLLEQADVDVEIREAIETIARRSEGLMRFVSRYRELLKVPDPQFADVNVASALSVVVTLLGDALGSVAVRVHVHPESLSVQADPDLLDQVLVNLIKNATDALAGVDAPALELEGRLDRGRVLIRVADNGAGISETDLDQIFVPFFTTKRDGSGIGLSLSRQIMIAHGGDMTITSESGRGTQVSLRF